MPDMHRGPPAIPQAQRRQAEGRSQTSGNDGQSRSLRREQGIIRNTTTINNQDDFLEALRNNPAWREAVRAQILGDELLQLPVRFDAFVQEFETFAQEQTRRLENAENPVQEQSAQTANLRERADRVENDMNTLKGDFARNRTIQDAPGIASDMGLEFVRTLSARDLSDMAGDTLPRDIGRSFRNADLVIEATDGADTRYIAMEVSFTGNLRDCDRAIRNAGLITRFTGKPAQAAVASVRNDREATEAVEFEAVYWHPLEDRTPSPE